ncbi:MAG: hydrogenase maturation protease [Sedimentisphaerales bacterium]|nr:hydrogenase maturation protease [Sedimentisphaerales bacterium]
MSTQPAWCGKSVLILGCGNILLADDGFGPAVAQYLEQNYAVPDDVCVLNVGTSVREILFDTILSDEKPSKIVIVDAMDCALAPGELFSPDISSLPHVKLDDFSMHQLPTSNLLRELRDHCGIEVIVIACQVAGQCDVVNPGLSPAVAAAVKPAAELLANEHFR